MSIASRRRKSGRLSGAVFDPVSPEEFSVRWHPITSTETAKEHMEDIMSSPDPLNDSAADVSIFFPPSAVRSRVSRSASPRKQPASASRRSVSPQKQQSQHRLTSSIRRSVTRSVSPRKQTFELEVGDNTAPQRLLVTVETDENVPPSPVNTRRKLFQSPGSEPTIARHEKATTTKIPLKGDDDVSPRKRGRPRKTNGTPVPGTRRRAGTPAKAPRGTPRPLAVAPPSDTDDALSLIDVQSTPKRRGRPPKNADMSILDLPPSSASRPSARRGRPPKARLDEPSSEAGPVPSSVATAPRTAGRRRRLAMDQEELVQMADIAADATIDVRATPIPSDNDMDLITMPTIENERPELPSAPSPGDKSDIWLTGLDEPTPRPRKRTSRSTSVQSPARKRVNRSSSNSSRQDEPEEPAFPNLAPTGTQAIGSDVSVPAPEDDYPDLPAAPSEASSLADEPREEVNAAPTGIVEDKSIEAPVEVKEPDAVETSKEQQLAELVEEETPKPSRRGDQLPSAQEPNAQVSGSAAEASDLSSIDDANRGDRTDTIAQEEDFSMIFAHSLPSLQNSLRQSYRSATGAPIAAPNFDEHEIGEETGLIINNTLEDLRQSQMRRSQMTNQDEEHLDEHPGDIFDRSQIRYAAASAPNDAQLEDEHPGDLFDRSQIHYATDDQIQVEQAESADEPLRQSYIAERRELGQQDGEPMSEGLGTQPVEEDEDMPDASPLVARTNGTSPTPQQLSAQFGSSQRSQRFQQPESAPVSSSPFQADKTDADSPSSDIAADPSPSHAFSFAYARSPRKMSSPLRHQVLRHTARQAHVDSDIPEENGEDSLRQSTRHHGAGVENEDTKMYDDSFSEIPDQILAAATPFRSQPAKQGVDPVLEGQEAVGETITEAEAEALVEIATDDEMDLVDVEAPAEAQPGAVPEIQIQTDDHTVINGEAEELLQAAAESAAGSENGRLPTPDDTPPHMESDADEPLEEDKTPEASDVQQQRSSPPQPSPSSLQQSEGEEITDIEVQAPNRRAIPSLQPTLSIEHAAPLPKVTPINQFSSPVQENPSLMPPENLLNRSTRPTLSPIVRAGRVLQSVTSDPPSPEGQRHLGSPFRSSASKDSDRNQTGRRSASPPRKFGFPPVRSSSVGAPPANADPFRSTSRSGQHTSFFQSLGRSMSSAGGHKRAISQDSLSSLRHAPSTDGRMSWIANEGPISPRLRGDNTLREAALATFGAPDVHPLSRSTPRQASSELGDADVQQDTPHASFGRSVYQPPAEPTEPLDQSLVDLLDDEVEVEQEVVEEMQQAPAGNLVTEPVAKIVEEPEEEDRESTAPIPEPEPEVDIMHDDGELSEDERPTNEPEEETDIWEFEASRIEPRSIKRQEPFGRKAPEPILRRGTIPSPWKPGKRKEPIREPSPELHPDTFADATELPSDADEFSLLAAQRRAEEQKARGGESASKANRFDLSSFFSSPAAIPGMIAAKTMSLLGSKQTPAQSAAPAKSPLAARVEESIAESSTRSISEDEPVEKEEAEEEVMDEDTTVALTIREQPDAEPKSVPAQEPEMVQVKRQPRQQPMSAEIQATAVPSLAASKPTLAPPQPLYPHIPQQGPKLSSPRRDLFSSAKTNTSPKRFEISSPRKALFSPIKSSIKGKEKEKTPEPTGSASPPTPEQVQVPVTAQKQNFTPRQRQSSQTYYQPSSNRPEPPSQPQSVAQTPPRMQLSHADIAKWREETNANGVDDSVDSPNFKRPLLRPLPPRNASPKKSSLRSPLKPHTPGPVVEFTSSVLSPLEQQQIRQQSARGSIFGPDLFGQPLVNPPEKDDSDVVMTDASPATTVHSPPKPLSQTIWTREHWLLLDQLLQLRRKGPFEGGFDRSAASEKLVGKTVTSQGEGMRLQSWHMDCVDAFRFEVGGWEEKVLAMRLFALLLGEVRRAKEKEVPMAGQEEEEEESVMFH